MSGMSLRWLYELIVHWGDGRLPLAKHVGMVAAPFFDISAQTPFEAELGRDVDEDAHLTEAPHPL